MASASAGTESHACLQPGSQPASQQGGSIWDAAQAHAVQAPAASSESVMSGTPARSGLGVPSLSSLRARATAACYSGGAAIALLLAVL